MMTPSGLASPTPQQVCTDETSGRVLLVAPQPFFAIAGTPLNILQMCRALTELGYEVHLATLPMGQHVALPKLVYHRVRRVPSLDHVPIGFSFAKGVYYVLLAAMMLRLLRNGRFVAIHAIEEAAFFAVPIARWFRTPVVADLDFDLCDQLRSSRSVVVRSLAGIAHRLRRYALKRATCALTVARALTRLVEEESPGTRVFEVRDIPNDLARRPPDPDALERLRRELALSSRQVIVYTGNFDRRQGAEVLIDATAAIHERFPDAVLLLVGGEPHQIEALQRRAAALGVAHIVRLVGKRPPEQMPEFMALATVLVSPRQEPHVTPLKIYSYMASGRPIVATDLPTHTDVLDRDAAILVPPTAEGLASGIMQVLDNPTEGERLGQRARQKSERDHTYEAFKGQILEVYSYLESQNRREGKEMSSRM